MRLLKVTLLAAGIAALSLACASSALAGAVVTIGADTENFGDVNIHIDPYDESLTVDYEVGNAYGSSGPFDYTGLSITGSGAAHFGIQPGSCTSATLQAAESCFGQIKFTPPSTTGPVSATITPQGTGADTITPMTLSANMIDPVLAVSPSTGWDFGIVDQYVIDHGGAPSKAFTISNTGVGTAVLANVEVENLVEIVFGLNNGTCGAAPVHIAAGSSCTLSVGFDPPVPVTAAAVLSWDDNTENGGFTAEVNAASAWSEGSAAPSSIAFGSQYVSVGSASQAVTVSNTGTVPLKVNSVAIGGNNPSYFTIAGSTCGATVAVGATCAVQVAFDPPFPGEFSAALNIATGDPAGTYSVAMGGVGVNDPPAPVTPLPPPPPSGLTAKFAKISLKNAKRIRATVSCPTNSCVVRGSLKLKPPHGRAITIAGDPGGASAGGTGSVAFVPTAKQRKSLAALAKKKQKVKATATLTDTSIGRSVTVTLTAIFR